MTTEDTYRAGIDHQLKACLKYADQLLSQLRSFRGEGNPAMRDLALLMMALLNRGLALNRGENIPEDLSDDCVTSLLSSSIYRLGCNIAISSQEPLALKYYRAEYAHPDQESFSRAFSIPAGISAEIYAKAWTLGINGCEMTSMTLITEEEWLEGQDRKRLKERKNESAANSTTLIPTDSVYFSPEERMILDRFETAGALKAFNEAQMALVEHWKQAPTKNLQKMFLGYLAAIVPYKKMPSTIHDQLTQEFGGNLTYYQANAIVMVLSEGEIRRFIPIAYIGGTGKRPQSVNLGGLHVEQKTPLARYNKTRYGYVPPDQHLFLQSLLHSVGSFGREMKNLPIRSSETKVVKSQALVEQPPANPPFDLTKARFTAGALLRYAELCRPKTRAGLEKDALNLLAKATKDGAISPEGLVRRTIDHKFEEALYFKSGRYRFVVREDRDNDTFKILTVERAYL